MVNETAISFKDVSVGYQHRHGNETILSNLNISLAHGELVGAVGLNGSGKSTLLRSIAGLLPVLDGKILVEGRSIDDYSTLVLARKVSVVLTEKVGGFNLTVHDLVATGQMPYTDAFHRLQEAHIQIIDKAIARCGVSSYRHKSVSQLSDGMFQKAMIARSLAQQTPVMLLDEPSAFLDYASRHALFQLLRQLSVEEKKCIMVTSHDLDLLLKYCHKILIIREGSAMLCDVNAALSEPGFKEITGGYL
jgi:iron complex transport system ATP-binding protein